MCQCGETSWHFMTWVCIMLLSLMSDPPLNPQRSSEPGELCCQPWYHHCQDIPPGTGAEGPSQAGRHGVASAVFCGQPKGPGPLSPVAKMCPTNVGCEVLLGHQT